VLVWVISIFYFISAGFTILSLALIYSGLAPLRDEQRQYFQSLTAFDHTMTVLIAALNLCGAVFLILLKRPAYRLFRAAFGIAVLVTFYQIIAKHWLSAVEGPGLIGIALGWGVNVAVILYSKRLIVRGVLK